MPTSYEELLSTLVAKHPEVLDATQAQMLTWAVEHPWLGGTAKLTGADAVLVAHADMAHSYQKGIEFEQLTGHPPTHDDWSAMYFDRANQFADYLGIHKPYDKPNNRLRLEYGGPF